MERIIVHLLTQAIHIWFAYPENAENALDAVEWLAQRYSADDVAFVGIGLLDETEANGSLGWVEPFNPTRRVTHWVYPGYKGFQFAAMYKNCTLL
ncbi:unnamed protein product, partial [Rotaria magnacalcarata]